jgi:hypothetical protein
MAEKKATTKRRSSGAAKGAGRSGGEKGSDGRGRTGESRALSRGAGQRRSGASQPKRTGGQSRSRSNASKNDRNQSSAKTRAAKAATGGKPMGRPPEEDPDVFVDVPNVHVGKLEIDVERLQAHLALRTQVANLLGLVAGVHVDVDKVKIDIEEVDASAMLKVRLHNTYNILDRTLTTIDENPEILQGVVDTVGSTVEQVGEIGTEATKPGGAVSELSSGVGHTVGNVADSLRGVTDKVNPKRLVAGSGRAASKGKSSATPGARKGKVAKAAGRVAAGGAASLLGTLLYRASRRPRVLGVPIGRKRGLERVVKKIGEASPK